jgi:hypothetical protein
MFTWLFDQMFYEIICLVWWQQLLANNKYVHNYPFSHTILVIIIDDFIFTFLICNGHGQVPGFSHKNYLKTRIKSTCTN